MWTHSRKFIKSSSHTNVGAVANIHIHKLKYFMLPISKRLKNLLFLMIYFHQEMKQNKVICWMNMTHPCDKMDLFQIIKKWESIWVRLVGNIGLKSQDLLSFHCRKRGVVAALWSQPNALPPSLGSKRPKAFAQATWTNSRLGTGKSSYTPPDPTKLDQIIIQPTLIPPLGLQANVTKWTCFKL